MPLIRPAGIRAALSRVRRRGDDAGVSLVELLVTMGLMSIVGALTVGWLVQAGAASSTSTEAGLATSGARAALQSWAGMLRLADSPTVSGSSANRFVAIDPTSITFNAALGNRPACAAGQTCATSATTQVRLALQQATVNGKLVGQLVQTVTPAGGASSTAAVLVPSGAAVLDSGCLFTPYDSAGTQLPCSSVTRLSSIARVDLGFSVTPTGGTAQTYLTSALITGTFS